MQVVPVVGCMTLIVDQAYKYYREFEPGTTEEAFSAQFIRPIRDMGAKAGERLLTELLKVEKSNELFDATFAPMLIAIGFAGQSMYEEERGEHEVALLLLMEAKYWCGVMWASRGVREAREKTVRTTRRMTGKKAGAARYSKLREHAKEIAVRKFSDRFPMLTTSAAAGKMVDELYKYAVENGLTPVGGNRSEGSGSDGGQKTVATWLRQWSDEGLINLIRRGRRQRR